MAADTHGRGHQARSPVGQFTRTTDTAERDAEAARLRRDGKGYPEIAAAMGYADKSSARKAVQRALAEIVAEPAEEVRTLEVARYDHYLDMLKPKVEAGEESAIATSLRVSERRARLLGLDSPVKVQTDATVRIEIVGVDLGKLT